MRGDTVTLDGKVYELHPDIYAYVNGQVTIFEDENFRWVSASAELVERLNKEVRW